MSKILVTCYVDPDLDGTAGAIAYAEFLNKSGQEAVAGIVGEPHEEAKYVLERFLLEYPESIPDSENFEKVILIDASDIVGLAGKIEESKVVEIIDHRKLNQAEKFVNAEKVQIEFVGAAATLVAERFMNSNIKISKSSAILLYGAIISNTLNFKATVTTDRDRVAANWLNQFAKLSMGFWKELFLAKSNLDGKKLEERIRHDFSHIEIAEKKIGASQIEMIGVRKMINERRQEIFQILEKIKKELNLDYVYQTNIELEEDKNYFLTEDKDFQKILENALAINFINNLAEREGLIMRKQIGPLLKEQIEKNNLC